MIDAIDRLRKLKEAGFHRLDGIDSIYMITPMFFSPTFEKGNQMKFLDDFMFKTNHYTPDQLKDEEFVNKSNEAKLAKNIFGSQKTVATAIIDFKTLASKEWQDKKIAMENKLSEKGITFDSYSPEK